MLTLRSLGHPDKDGARLGTSTAAADVNLDGYTDLLVSAPGLNLVYFVYGSALGLSKGKRSTVWFVPWAVKAGDRVGASIQALPVPDANNPRLHRRHILVGAPGTDSGRATDAGVVYDLSIDATTGSISTARIVQGLRGIPGKAEKGDRFGEVMSAGSLGDGSPTVAIGVPHEDVGTVVDAGAVYVMSGAGLATVKPVSRSSKGAPGTARKGDLFGRSVSARGNAVSVGVPGHDVGKATDAGAVQQIKIGANGRVQLSRVQTQNSPGVTDTAEKGDHLGTSVTWTSDNGVAAGAPGEDVGRAKDAGAVTYVSFDGSCTATCFTVTQNSLDGGHGKPETGDHFGASMATGSQGGDPVTYGPMIGVPGEDVGVRKDVGGFGGWPWSPSEQPLLSAGEHLGEVAPTISSS